MTERQNCWEFKKCGREPNGIKAAELGVCPVTIYALTDGFNGGKNGGRICWAIAGTFLHLGNMQGIFAKKRLSCVTCKFFNLVESEEGADFMMFRPDYQNFAK
jgi:hypothetical protein